MYVCMYVCMYMYVHVHVCMYVCMYACMHVCTAAVALNASVPHQQLLSIAIRTLLYKGQSSSGSNFQVCDEAFRGL